MLVTSKWPTLPSFMLETQSSFEINGLPVRKHRDVPDPMTSEAKATCAERVSTIAGIVPLSTGRRYHRMTSSSSSCDQGSNWSDDACGNDLLARLDAGR